MAVLAVVGLAVAGSLAFALSRQGVTPSAGKRSGAAAAAQERAVRGQAASWVAAQVSQRAVVSCDPVMCRTLRAHGFPATRLRTLRPDSVSPLGSWVVIATPAIRAQFGSLLGSVYAPAVLASFGTGRLRVDIRVAAAHGAAAYRAAVRADLRARKQSAAQLLSSQRIKATAAARSELARGQVDSRLLVTLAGLAARRPLSVVAFGGTAPGASPGTPLRWADLGVPGGTRRPVSLRPVTRFLRALPAPYRPARVQTVRLPGGRTVLRIEFTAPSPLGLLAPA